MYKYTLLIYLNCFFYLYKKELIKLNSQYYSIIEISYLIKIIINLIKIYKEYILKYSFRKKWTHEEELYIIENTGKLTNRYMAKKFNVKIETIIKKQFLLGVTITDNLTGHNYITQNELSNKLGLTINQLKNFKSEIKFKRIGKPIVISFDEADKIENFLNDYISVSQASKILKLHPSVIQKYQKKFPEYFKKIGSYKLLYIKKEKILLQKQYLKNSLTVKEFSKKVFYSDTQIREFIKEGIIISFIDVFGKIRISKSELKKFSK